MGFLSTLAEIGTLGLADGDKFENWAGEQWGNISGETQANAIGDAAQLQNQAAMAGIEAQTQAQQQMRQDLQPFAQFGAGLIPQANQAFSQSQGLFGPNAGMDMMNNPMFQALQAQAQEQILNNQAVRGRLGTGETPQFMQDAALRTGFDILQQERNASLQNRNSLMQALGLGQASAAQVGASGMNAASNIANLLGQGANAQAGGLVGAANASAQGTGNLVNLGTTIAGTLLGGPAGGAAAGGAGGSFNFGQPSVAQNQFGFGY